MYRFVKRFLDFVFSLVATLAFFPILLILSFVLAIYYKGNPFFWQLRPGLRGKVFKMFKFRSMTNAKDEYGRLLPNKERLTPLGKFLRSSSLDELPGLINVIKGEMSLVGPRPLRVEYLPLYSANQARRHEVKPGITGWAQVNGRNTLTWEAKFKLDVWYVDNSSFFLDTKILLLTIYKVFKREGVNQAEDVTMEPFKGIKIR